VYAAASCATDGIGAEVTDGDGAAEGTGVAVAGDAGVGPGVALAGGVDDGAGVAVEAGVAAPGVPVASATECPGEGDNRPATASVRKTTTVIRTTA
jgi:hypothetical protein